MFKNDADTAQVFTHRVLLENPAHGAALSLQRQIDEQLKNVLAAGPGLNVKFQKPVSLQFRDATIKVVFEALSRTSGINVLLDKEVKADAKISIFVQDIAVADAIDLILLQAQLEKKLISDNTVLVYQNTPAKMKEFQDLKIRSFHLVNADAKQLVTMIKTLLKTKDIFVHEKTNSIVMRDTPDVIELAGKLVDDQDIPDPEVMLEVEVLEVSGSRLAELGVNYPSSLNFSLQSSGLNGTLPVEAFRHLNGGNILVSPVPALTLNMLWQDGSSNLLASPRIRARNHEKAKVMIGDRVPVITNAITPVSTGTPVVTGSVQYLDVGLKLEVEPEIHLDNDVSIKINLEVSSIVKEVQNAVSGTLAYQVGTRNASTVLRLKDGETQILAGLINDEDRNGASRVPGLGSLPVLGQLFSSNKTDNRKSEIVLSITPHVVGSRRSGDARTTEFWAGSEATPRNGSLMARSFGVVSASASAARAAGRGAGGQTMPPPAPSAPSTQPVIVTWQGPNQAKIGEKISVTLNAQSSQPLKTIALALGYDPAMLRPVDVSEGDFVNQAGLPSVFVKNAAEGSGEVLLELTNPSAAGSSGAGTLATVVFEVIGGKGTAQVKATQASATGAGGEPVAVNVTAPFSIEVGL
jgi:general secretion pathway protein D